MTPEEAAEALRAQADEVQMGLLMGDGGAPNTLKWISSLLALAEQANSAGRRETEKAARKLAGVLRPESGVFDDDQTRRSVEEGLEALRDSFRTET